MDRAETNGYLQGFSIEKKGLYLEELKEHVVEMGRDIDNANGLFGGVCYNGRAWKPSRQGTTQKFKTSPPSPVPTSSPTYTQAQL